MGLESYESSWVSPSVNWYMGFCGSVVSSRASRAVAGLGRRSRWKMLHMPDVGREGQQRWHEGLLQPLSQSWACRWGKHYPKREMLSWKGQEQHPGVWLRERCRCRQAGRGRRRSGSRLKAGGSDPRCSLGRVGKPVTEGVRVFMGTSRPPRHGQPVLGVHGTLPGI